MSMNFIRGRLRILSLFALSFDAKTKWKLVEHEFVLSVVITDPICGDVTLTGSVRITGIIYYEIPERHSTENPLPMR